MIDPAVSVRNLEATTLQLGTTGLRFTSPATESEYRAWSIEEGIPLTRIGMLISVLNFAATLGVLVLVSAPHLAAIAAWILLVMIPSIVTTLLVTYRPTLCRLIAPLTGLTNGLAGLTCVCVAYWSLRRPELSMAGVMMVSQFAFTIFPLRVGTAVLAVTPFVVLHEVLALEAYTSNELDRSSLLLYSLGPCLAYVTGLLANVITERGSRARFRQGKIIELQKKTIERERARADVAERSRELSEALSKLTDSGRPLVQLAPGDLVDNRFRIIKLLGRGGMGEVYEVEQLTDGKHVALKVLTGKIDREALMRFAREARLAASLDHPNVVEVVDVGVGTAGMFLVMELITGSTLAAAKLRFGILVWALPILRQVASALAAMHGRGIVHRDLKPGNILLEGDIPKVTDFGIASLTQTSDLEPVSTGDTMMASADPALTRTGVMLGTPLYMAPELTSGSHSAHPAADIWAFGVIAHEMLTGKHPFSEPPILARLAGRPVPIPTALDLTIDPELLALLVGCLSERPEQRPTAHALSAALEQAHSA